MLKLQLDGEGIPRTAQDHASCTLQRGLSSIPSLAPREFVGAHSFPCSGYARSNPFTLGPVNIGYWEGHPPSVNPWARLTRSFRKSDLAPLSPLKGMTPILADAGSYFRLSMHTATRRDKGPFGTFFWTVDQHMSPFWWTRRSFETWFCESNEAKTRWKRATNKRVRV